METLTEKTYQALSLRLPVDLHWRASIKNAETRNTFQNIFVKAVMEYLGDAPPPPPKRAPKLFKTGKRANGPKE